MQHNRSIGKRTNEETGEVTTWQKNYYICGQSKYGVEFCTGHRINGGVVEQLVLETLQRVSQYATTNEKEFTRQINEMYSTQQADTAKAGRKKLKQSQNRHAELDKLIQRIYEDNVAGKINDKRFEVLSNQYEQEQAELEQAITDLTAALDSYEESTDRAAKFLELTKRYKEFSEITPTMLHEFVDRIEVHERADKRYKITTQKVDIYLNFIGAYSPPAEAQPEEPDLRTDEEYEAYMQKLSYMREYRKRRAANGGKPLGHFEGKRPDDRTPEEITAAEAERKAQRRAYNQKYYQDNKTRLDAEQAARNAATLAAMTPAEHEERKRKRREYESGYRDRNREKHNAYMRERRKLQRAEGSLLSFAYQRYISKRPCSIIISTQRGMHTLIP